MKNTLLALLTLLFLALPAQASHYLEPDTIDPALLVPPPAIDSPQWKVDLEAVLRAQEAVTDADKQAILDESELGVEPSIAPLGTYTAVTHPALFKLVENLRADCKPIVGKAKEFWDTKRPYLLDERIKNIAKDTRDRSYPSGHTACSRLYAEALAQVVPAKREELRAKAASIAWRRVQAGVHFPHDLNGGRQLAMLMLGALQTNAAYKADVAAAKAEIAAKQ